MPAEHTGCPCDACARDPCEDCRKRRQDGDVETRDTDGIEIIVGRGILVSAPGITAMGALVMERHPWKVYRQDAGMGETDYVILRFDTFFARVPDESIAGLIVSAVDRIGKGRASLDARIKRLSFRLERLENGGAP